jgi:hypothetical protein
MTEPNLHFCDTSRLPHPKRAIESGDLQAALGGFATREMLEYRQFGRFHSDVWVCGFGVTLWLMGDTLGAAKVWSEATSEAQVGKFKYSSTGNYQPGLLLWFASVWLKDEKLHAEAAALLTKLLSRKRLVMGADFSILVARLLRREIDLFEILASSREQQPQIQQSRDCVALFYAGVRTYEDGDLRETLRLWRQIPERTRSSVDYEYYLMEHEREKLVGRGL